jgi:hypothetical protein
MSNNLLKMIFMIVVFSVSSCKAQCDNNFAIKQFESDIAFIRNSIKNTNDNKRDLPTLINRIEKISSIQSVSDGNYFGKFNPTESDIKKWEDWLKNNKENICWDKINNEFYLISKYN